jgi:hypothetical protein
MAPRFDHNASAEAIHEAGHAVERYLLHGTTGAIRSEPFTDKLAGAETEPFPESLMTNNGTTLKDPPYDADETTFLLKEIKTTLAGAVAEGLMRGKGPLDVLGESEQSSDDQHVHAIAKRLWPHDEVKNAVDGLIDEVILDIDGAWQKVTRVAEAYERQLEAGRIELTAGEVLRAIQTS